MIRISGLALALALAAPARAQEAACPADPRAADGRTVAQAADSLFALAATQSRPAQHALVPFTRRPRMQGRPPMGSAAMDLALLRRLSASKLHTLVAYQLDADGRPVRVEVVRPSGERELDALALESFRGRRYAPARAGECAVPFFAVERFELRVRA